MSMLGYFIVGSILRTLYHLTYHRIMVTPVLRRTGASNLLRAGVSTDKISIMLGHQNISTVDPYLSMDEKRMLLCCGDFKIPGFRRSPNEV